MNTDNQARSRRIDIDILRAVAVTAVVLFHFEVPGFSGGFLGVDIFFVISGYLITLHITEQMATGEFRFTYFYLRRIRRLFPAIAVTLLLCSIASLILFPQTLLRDFSHSQIAATFYVSNIYFWSIADYFDTESIVKPLLHTWSLSVEEQFYILWPFLLLISNSRRQLVWIISIGAFSLIASELTINHSPNTAFFHFPFRIFEFAIGAAVAKSGPLLVSSRNSSALVLLCVVAIATSLTLLSEANRNPGLSSLALCTAIAILIGLNHPVLNQDSWLTKVLVRIGLLSYSIYLVHWPLLVFYKVTTPGALSVEATLWLLFSTLIIAELLYRFVEKPCLQISIRRHRLALFLLIPCTMIFATSFNMLHHHIYKMMNPEMFTVSSILDAIPDRRQVLDVMQRKAEKLEERSSVEKTHLILIIGDSHSVDLYHALRPLFADTRYAIEMKHQVCDPLAIESIQVPFEELYEEHAHAPTRNPDFCSEHHLNFVRDIVERDPDLIIFSEAWRKPTLALIKDTVLRIQKDTDAEVLLMGETPIFAPHPNVLFRGLDQPGEIDKVAWARVYKYLPEGDTILEKVASDTNSHFISKNELVCPQQQCRILIDWEIGYVDSNHWSIVGMEYYGNKLIRLPEFQEALNQATQ